MRYLCLGCLEPGKFEGMIEDEQHAMLDEYFEYNDHLRASGHVVAEVPRTRSEESANVRGGQSKIKLNRSAPTL